MKVKEEREREIENVLKKLFLESYRARDDSE